MIKSLTATTLTQVCGACGDENAIAVSGLECGDEGGSADNIALPACPGCGAGEVLIRTHAATVPLHAKVVNRLHKRLKDAAQKCTGFPGGDSDAPDLAADDATLTVVS